MRRCILWMCLGLFVSCGGGEKHGSTETESMEPAPADPRPGPADPRPVPADPRPVPADPRPGPAPGGNKPGACQNVAVPQGSTCRLAGVWSQNCPDCGENWRLFHSSHFVMVGDVKYGFESGAYRIPADREQEFRDFMRQKHPAPCGGMIIRPPCNPSATRVKLELDWPPWVKHERR